MNKNSIYGFSLFDTQGKDTDFICYQFKKAHSCFYEKPKTRMQVATETGIRVQNICRYVGAMEKKHQIKVILRGKCPVTNYPKSEFLTTNSKLW